MDCHAYARNDEKEKSLQKHDNNVALAHCVNNSEGRKIVKAHKGFANGVL